MAKKTADKGYGKDGFPSSSELSENMPRQNFRLGDITWVKHSGSSWWPAQVIDEACVSGKPKKKTSHDALVRLYGTCDYLYVDPWNSNVEFETILKKEDRTAMEAFHEVLEKELSRVRSPSDYDEGAVNSKAKTSSRKVRKQEVGSKATSGVASRKGRKQEGAEQSNPAHDKEQAIDEVSSDENSAEGLRDRRSSVVQDRKGRKTATLGISVTKREGLRRSGGTNAKEYSEAAEDNTSQLHDMSPSENATEVGDITSDIQKQHKNDSVVHGTHGEIKAMVRDILLGDIISRQHAAEMAYVDEVILGICHATEENGTDGATAVTKDGRGIKRTGSRLEADSSNVAPRPRKGKVDKATEASRVTDLQAMNSSPSRDAAMEGLAQRRVRQIKIMQTLGLIAPAGSPFGSSGFVAASHR